MQEQRKITRLNFQKALRKNATASTSGTRRFVLGQKTPSGYRLLSSPSPSRGRIFHVAPKAKSPSEILLRNVLVNPEPVKIEDSIYHQMREEALRQQSGSAWQTFRRWLGENIPTLTRIVANVVGDTSTLLLRASGILRGGKARKSENRQVSDGEHSASKKKRGFIKEMVKTGFVAGGTFTVVMVLMNWTAYASITTYTIEKWKGTNIVNEQQMAALVEEPEPVREQVVVEEKLAISDVRPPVLPRAGLERPPLTLDVTPSDNRIIIPKINKNVPIINISEKNLIKQNWKALEEDMQNGLMNGVVHYPGTAKPGQVGNFFITGHSSFYAWTKSKYKDVFALLPELQIGDRVTVYYDQRKYTYEIMSRETVRPTDTSPLKATNDKRITIMTCVPIGTDLSRLILVGKLVEK